MKRDILNILCCPTCKGDLDLKITDEQNDEILTGIFTCKKCHCIYPIEDGIPNLLPR